MTQPLAGPPSILNGRADKAKDRQTAVGAALERLRTCHPEFHALLDAALVDNSLLDQTDDILDGAFEFLDDSEGGRGSSYRRAQRSTFARAEGARSLLSYLSSNGNKRAKVLDVLGGDGLLARIVRKTPELSRSIEILTGDISLGMVEAALAIGLPAVCQPAQRLMLRNGCMDAVLVAYGTHHLSVENLATACEEAGRVLKPGGRVLLHDFEPGSSVARWFAEVVHPYSRKGHDYPHYGVNDLSGALRRASFEVTDARELDDPIVAWCKTPDTARSALALYLHQMYGLVGLGDEEDPAVQELVLLCAERCFGPVKVRSEPNGFSARLLRRAAIAAGTRR